jgi:dolichol kinase
MNEQALFAILFLVIFLLLVIATYWMHEHLAVGSDISRKFLHVSGGLLSLSSPFFFSDHWWVLAICSIAFVLLLVTYLKNWLPSIHAVKRHSVGSVIFPVPIYCCFFLSMYFEHRMLFFLPITFLTVSDTVAEWSGKKWGKEGKSLFRNGKTFAGSAGFAITAFVAALIYGFIDGMPAGNVLLMAFTTTFMATLAESFSTYGWDNLSVPLVTVAVLLLLYSSQFIV